MNISTLHKPIRLIKRIGLILLSACCFLSCIYGQGTVQTNVPALKDVYKNDFYIGCLLSYRHVGFTTDPVVPGQSSVVAPQGGDLIKFHMNSMTPGNNMKMLYTVDISGSASAYINAANSTIRDSIEIHPIIKFNADLVAQLNWAQRQGFTFRGHTLVWHSQTAPEFFYSGYTTSGQRLTKQVMTQRMENYIKEIIRTLHEGWPGLLSAIDVVNESVNDGSGTFRTSGNEWYTTFGDNTYVMKAFEFARKYTTEYSETQMKLYYNDYNTQVAAKADGIVALCQPIFAAGYLDGIGMQQHDNLNTPTAEAWIATYNKFAPICTEMAVTELDISTNSGTNTPSQTILTTQANQYAMLFKCYLDRSFKSGRGKIINVSKDGLNDTYTFVTNQSTSLWDTQNQCKPSFYAVADIAKYYYKLDTLIHNAEALNQSNYTTQNWTIITNAVNAAKSIKNQNYSASNSAVTAFLNACTNLDNAVKNTPTGISSVNDAEKVYAYISNETITIKNIPANARIELYSFTGSLLNQVETNEQLYYLPYIQPCIIRVISGKNVNILKVTQ